MSKRRVVAATSVVMALVCAALPVPSAALQGGALFGIHDPANVQADAASLVMIDPVSGSQTLVADLSTLAFQPAFGPLAATSSQPHLIYAVGTYCIPTCPSPRGESGVVYSEIVTVNSQTAAVHVSPALASPIYGGIALDPATQTLWALTLCPCSTISIVRVNPSTGAETIVAAIADPLGPELPQLALDPASHVLYVATTTNTGGQLLALDTTTGTLSAGLNLAASVSSIVYDTSSAKLFGVTTGTPEQLAKIDPATGTETGIATFGANISVSGAALDSASHTVFGVEFDSLNPLVEEIVMVNDQTGATSVGGSVPADLGYLAFAGATRDVTQSPSISPLPRGPVSQSSPSSPGTRLRATSPARQVRSSLYMAASACLITEARHARSALIAALQLQRPNHLGGSNEDRLRLF